MTFQMLDYKGNNFLDLFNDNHLLTIVTYMKGGTWLKHIGHSNSPYVRATRAITNHTLIDEYYLRFFLRESFKCLCGSYLIKSRYHIIHECRRYNNY